MTVWEKIASGLLKPINTSAIILLGFYTVLWGFWVGNPFWDVFTQAGLYDAMSTLLPEYVWGIAACIIGAVIIYGVIRPSYRNLARGALTGGWYWLLIALFYFVGDWRNTGGITAGIFALYSAFIYINLRVNKQRFKWSEVQGNEAIKRIRKQSF